MMKNLFFSKAYLTSCMLCAILLVNGVQVSAQYDLLYENHEQNLARTPRAIADDGQGNTYLAGKFAVSLTLGAFTLTNTGVNENGGNGATGFVGKFNSVSNTWLWAKKITLVPGGSGYNQWVLSSDIMALATDNAGNVYITGIYIGVVKFDNITLTSTKLGNQYSPDIFVAKYNTNGGIVWAKSFGSKAGLDMGRTIALDASNNIFIGGMFTNKAINCGAPSTTSDLYDVCLAKLNNAGTALWQKRYASSSLVCTTFNSGNDLSVDGSGNVCLTGQFTGTVSFGTGSGLSITSVSGTVDVFAAKINGSGTTQWVKAAGSSSYDYGNSIYADASGDVYAGGKVGPDAFLTKYNSTGNVVWSVNPFPVSLDFPFSSISKINPYSNSILVNNERVGFKTISPADGSVISSDSLVGNTPPNGADATIADVAVAGSGYAFIVSGRCGTVTIGNTDLISANVCPYSGISRDIFIVRTDDIPLPFNQVIGTINPIETSREFAENEFDIYPNPASDHLHITLPPREQESTLFIQNQFGRTVWSEKFESQRRTATINLNKHSFQSGIYYLICLSNGEVKTERFVIDK